MTRLTPRTAALVVGAVAAIAVWAALQIDGNPVDALAYWAAGNSPDPYELNAANINLLLMAAVLAGFRWPVAWVPVLLTKPTAGLGLLWFVVRGEWRKAAIPILIAIVIAGISMLFAPDLWSSYLVALGRQSLDAGWPFPWPVWVRAPIAVALIVWGARTDRRWTLIVGTILAMPRLYFLSPAMLLAVLPTLRETRLGWPTVRRPIRP
jgi:hypothetical protein